MSELESPAVTTSVTPDTPALPQDDLTPPPPPPAPKKSRTGTFFIGALSGCLFILIAGALVAMLAFALDKDSGELSLSTHKVAIIPIEGEIFDSRETLDALDRYAGNATVKAIVIRINSPGGAIAPSQEIYSAIRRTRRDSGKPIVASMDSVAASGGYDIAAGCDAIVANPGTITGSIGVVLQWFDMEELVRWAKMKPETITSGPLKAAGSPYKELSEAERAYFQRID